MFLSLSKFHHLAIEKESSVTHTKDYCEEKAPKSPDFEGNFFEIAILDLIGSRKLQKHSRILNKICKNIARFLIKFYVSL
jgi:hypothetical protein